MRHLRRRHHPCRNDRRSLGNLRLLSLFGQQFIELPQLVGSPFQRSNPQRLRRLLLDPVLVGRDQLIDVVQIFGGLIEIVFNQRGNCRTQLRHLGLLKINVLGAGRVFRADLLQLDDALSDLERLDPRAAKVVELKYFGGYTDKEVAEALGLAVITIRRDWEFARLWLFEQMDGRAREGGGRKHVAGTSPSGS